MRRLHTSRAPEPDEAALEGMDRLDQEGDPIGPTGDELPLLRPFGAEVTGPVVAEPGAGAEPEPVRVPRQARELAALGRHLDAVLLLRRYLEEAPRDGAARALLAALLDEGGEEDEAVEELTRALECSDDAVQVLIHRGMLLARLGRAEEAEHDLRDAIRRGPGHAAAHFHLGVTLYRRGRTVQAAAALRQALEWDPEHAEASYYLAETLQAQGDLPGALAELDRTLKLAPDQVRSFKLRGRLLDRMGRTDEALAMHRKAREASIR
jgi:tetratricopeptide (TPR) repeat protein